MAELQDYTLVIFVHKGPKKKIEEIEIIPTNWLSVINNKVYTKYMTGKIESEDRVLLEDLIKTKVDAPSDWPLLHIKIIGRAKDYAEALIKSKNLEVQESVLTCDSDEEVEDVQNRLMTALKRRDLLKLQAAMFEKLDTTASESVGTRKKTTVKLNSASTDIHKDKSSNINAVPAILDVACSSGEGKPSTYNVESLSTDVDRNFPALNIEKTFECKSDFEEQVVGYLKQISFNVSGLLKRLDAIENFLLDKKLVNTTKGFIDIKGKYGLSIPFQTLDEFFEFDKHLKENKFLKQDVYTDLRTLLNSDGVISKCYVNMLKKYFVKDIALKFTASRVSSTDTTKVVLKNTEFCNCMDFIIISKRKSNEKTTEERDLTSGLSDVLSNVKKWTKLQEISAAAK